MPAHDSVLKLCETFAEVMSVTTSQMKLAFLLILGILSSAVAAPRPQELSISGLEQRLKEIDAQMGKLANYSLGGGIGAIGYRSQAHDTANSPEWVEIDFGNSFPLDEVVLVPAIRRDTQTGFQADAFPKRFRLIAGSGTDRIGKVVAQYNGDHDILPRIAPFVIPGKGIQASWIRIEADQLSKRAFDDRFVFQLSEIMAFSGVENVALHQRVKASSSASGNLPGWDVRYLVDGYVPYLMDAAEGARSVAYVAYFSSESVVSTDLSVTIDLGRAYPLSGVHLHAVEQSDTLPQAYAGDLAIPKRMRIEGANLADFSDATLLVEPHPETIYDVGPIMMWAFPETTCRYVRFSASEPYSSTLNGKVTYLLGFAEIEVFSKGRNVALGRPVATSFKQPKGGRPIAKLTDGLNFYGNILPLQDWMRQLALRHDLELERPRVAAELYQHYTRQKILLSRLGWLSIMLVLIAVVIVLVDRILRQRAIHQVRKRIAADLHDELGADLHAIGLMSDLARAAKTTPEKLEGFLLRLRALTERAGTAARHCTNMIEAKGLYEDLVQEMRRTSDRIMADLEHEIEFEGEETLLQLKPQQRVDLILFYQECLINIIRHSSATRVQTRLAGANGMIRLTVSDNGQGLNGSVPASLIRRAKLVGATVEAGPSQSNGSCICLNFKIRRFGILK